MPAAAAVLIRVCLPAYVSTSVPDKMGNPTIPAAALAAGMRPLALKSMRGDAMERGENLIVKIQLAAPAGGQMDNKGR